jgi:tetratricopeptide (TPR) repeat protein
MFYQRIFSIPSLSLLVLSICFFSYYSSVNVPFYLDDSASIVDNPAIKTIDISLLKEYFPLREVGYLTFAINYAISGADLAPLHLTNVLLHLLMGGAVFFLTLSLMKVGVVEESKAHYIALMSMTLFLLTPINSQAVIYIVQRLAIIVALFYVFGIIAYIKFRTTKVIRYRVLWAVLGFISFFLGLHSKQNIVTLPFAILVVEFFLIKRESLYKLPIYIVVLFLSFLSIWLADFILELEVIQRIDEFTKEADRVARWEYFTHQLTALWVYMIKFFVPFPLLLEYSSTPYTWSDDITWYSLIGHIIILGAAVKFGRERSIITVMIFCYYIAHIVESSFIPISDLMFEHRAYLPNTFLAIIAALVLNQLAQYRKWLPVVTMLGGVSVFSFMLMERVERWKYPIGFYRHELTYTADNARIYGALGALFAQKGEFRKAENWYKGALQIGLETGHLQSTTVIHYLKVLIQNNRVPQASRVGVQSLNMLSKPADRADVLLLLANLKAEQGLCKFANGLAARAARIYPDSADRSVNQCIERK